MSLPTASPAALPRSLRSRLLRHVIVPLALTWLLGTLLALGVARYFTQQAFDRALLDDAYAVASHVRTVDEGGLTLGLTAAEIGTLLFDQNESIFFAVYLQDGRLLAGHSGLKLPEDGGLVSPRFSEVMFQNRVLRAAVLARQQPLPYTVVVAQTTNSQDRLFQRLLFISLTPQVLLLIWLALWLRRVIQDDVQPLMDLEQAVAQRDARDFTPVKVSSRTRDVQRLGEAINALLVRIGQSVRAQKEFAGNVAHELRTPLAGVRALAEYALSQSDPKVWQEQLRSIAQSQERASHLIDQLLALALAEEAEQVLQPQRIALDEVVRDTLMRHLHRADALGVDLGARGLDVPVFVLAQRALVEGVLDNLIDNALRYGLPEAPSERHVTVEIAHDPNTAQVVLSVQDNGPGITEAQRTRVLSRWGQGSAGEALKQGSGLGLAIVSEYARILGASLTLGTGDDRQGLKVSLAFADQSKVG
jgi:two-component system, OmpR family, sensor histidine kinase TctE